MQFIDLKSQYKELKEQIDTNIHKVLDHGQYIMGPEVLELEEKFASYVGVKHCITAASGTDALIMALLAHGIGSGDFVITSPFTFIATAEAIKIVGATPIFVDIDPVTFNMDPVKLEETLRTIELGTDRRHKHLITDISKIKAVMTVDLFGLPAAYREIKEVTDKYGLLIIEDAAQGFGGRDQRHQQCRQHEA